jgi:hypothetical protein
VAVGADHTEYKKYALLALLVGLSAELNFGGMPKLFIAYLWAYSPDT